MRPFSLALAPASSYLMSLRPDFGRIVNMPVGKI